MSQLSRLPAKHRNHSLPQEDRYGLWFRWWSAGRIREEFESCLLSLSFSPDLCKRMFLAITLGDKRNDWFGAFVNFQINTSDLFIVKREMAGNFENVNTFIFSLGLTCWKIRCILTP